MHGFVLYHLYGHRFTYDEELVEDDHAERYSVDEYVVSVDCQPNILIALSLVFKPVVHVENNAVEDYMDNVRDDHENVY